MAVHVGDRARSWAQDRLLAAINEKINGFTGSEAARGLSAAEFAEREQALHEQADRVAELFGYDMHWTV